MNIVLYHHHSNINNASQVNANFVLLKWSTQQAKANKMIWFKRNFLILLSILCAAKKAIWCYTHTFLINGMQNEYFYCSLCYRNIKNLYYQCIVLRNLKQLFSNTDNDLRKEKAIVNVDNLSICNSIAANMCIGFPCN